MFNNKVKSSEESDSILNTRTTKKHCKQTARINTVSGLFEGNKKKSLNISFHIINSIKNNTKIHVIF